MRNLEKWNCHGSDADGHDGLRSADDGAANVVEATAGSEWGTAAAAEARLPPPRGWDGVAAAVTAGLGGALAATHRSVEVSGCGERRTAWERRQCTVRREGSHVDARERAL